MDYVVLGQSIMKLSISLSLFVIIIWAVKELADTGHMVLAIFVIVLSFANLGLAIQCIK